MGKIETLALFALLNMNRTKKKKINNTENRNYGTWTLEAAASPNL